MEAFEGPAKTVKKPKFHVEFCLGESSLSSMQQEEVKQYLRRLLGDLGIQVSLEIVFTSSDNLLENHISPGIIVNGIKGRIPSKNWFKGSEINNLISRLCEAIFLNRILLVTDEYADHLYCKWFLDNANSQLGASINKKQLKKLLERCTQLGLNMDIAKRVAEQWALYIEDIDGEDAENIEDDRYILESLLAAETPHQITVDVSSKLYETVFLSLNFQLKTNSSLDDKILLMRETLFYELGIQFPTVKFRLSTDLPNHYFQIWLHQIRGPLREGLAPDEVFVNIPHEQLKLLKIKGREAINPNDGSKSIIISTTDAEKLKELIFTRWNTEEHLFLTLAAELRTQASEYLSIAKVETILSSLNRSYPALVFKVLERFSLCTIIDVLQNLVKEKVSIRNMWTILETLLEVQSIAKEDFEKKIPISLLQARICPAVGTDTKLFSAKNCSEACRITLGSSITFAVTRGTKAISVWLLSKDIEHRVQYSNQAPMEEQEKIALLTEIDNQVSSFYQSTATTLPVILTKMSVRLLLREIIALEFPYINVLSYNELDPGVNIKPVACIKWENHF
ncbi:FHIPEP family type III secretion protein [Leptothoe spongobia]|uniref:FHIPEP family type III secretion protein n=1 Tax=Leptothoe spongobia TAU-MAC 1115 TaxID=1967444 RepID=A0A947GHA0_9CYAN|nr:FHIPEP family type III secretion protein [Leptothoe spongobia]MBT9315415.1 FHIPEP family type III secretion protein [Leptothoe spongobia TAU-MAC 1115]